VVQEMPDEVLVYDLKRHKAHCLNKTAAFVGITAMDRRQLQKWLDCLKRILARQLAKKCLCMRSQAERRRPAGQQGGNSLNDGMSRRRMLRGVGAVMVLPTVVSLIAPAAAAAVSIVTLGQENRLWSMYISRITRRCCVQDTCCTGECGGPQRGCVGMGPGSTPPLLDTSCKGQQCVAATNAVLAPTRAT
jgi:hypothetical protein